MTRCRRAGLATTTLGGAVLALACAGVGAAPAATALTASAALPSVSFHLVWSKDFPNAQFRGSSPVAASLDDAGPAVVVGGLDGKVYAFHASDGSTVPGWPAQLDKPIDSSPAVGYVTSTTRSDIYIGTGTYDSGAGGGYWGIGPDGKAFLHYVGRDPNQPAEAVFATPAVANLDCTSTPDLVAGALGQETYALNAANGGVLPGWPLFTYDTVFSSPAVANAGGQTLTFEGGDLTTPHGGTLRAINGSGQVVWSDPFDDVVTSSPAVGDLTGNGTPSLAVGSGFYWAHKLTTVDSSRLFVINPVNGATEWSHDLGGFTRTSPALGNLTGNGVDDVVEAVQGSLADPNLGEIWAFDGQGNVLPGWPQETPPGVGAVIGSVVTADLTGGGYDDVLVPTGDGLYVYDGRTGALDASVAVNRIGMQSSPLVSVDPNGTLGVTIAGTNTTTHDGVIFHYEVSGGRIDPTSWPMFRGDSARTGTISPPAARASGCGAALMGGYRFVGSDGTVYDFGAAASFGSAKGHISAPIVGMAAAPDNAGYWLLGRNGSVYPFGNAAFHGQATAKRIVAVDMAADPDGAGYWIVDKHGGVYAYGSARFFGSTGARKLPAQIVAMAATPAGNGYWLIGANGGVYPFGDAVSLGSTAGRKLPKPIVAAAATPTGRGYWLAGASGAVYAFGDARALGSAAGRKLAKPVASMAVTPDGAGYWLLTGNGQVLPFGDARSYPVTSGGKPAQPITAMDP